MFCFACALSFGQVPTSFKCPLEGDAANFVQCLFVEMWKKSPQPIQTPSSYRMITMEWREAGGFSICLSSFSLEVLHDSGGGNFGFKKLRKPLRMPYAAPISAGLVAVTCIC